LLFSISNISYINKKNSPKGKIISIKLHQFASICIIIIISLVNICISPKRKNPKEYNTKNQKKKGKNSPRPTIQYISKSKTTPPSSTTITTSFLKSEKSTNYFLLFTLCFSMCTTLYTDYNFSKYYDISKHIVEKK